MNLKKTEKTHPRVGLLKRVKKEEQRAMLWAMLAPCGGQIYNETYWTAGVFAALYAVTGVATLYWHRRYLEAGMFKLDNPDSDNSGTIRGCERFRTMGLIGLGLIYIFGIIESYSTASMKTFDISDDLSFVVEPKVSDKEAGIKLGLNFK
ncbi:MAG: DUF5683 domain-containing protein [Cytophagales bacterium]|nr:DUF5683 domain-containing protein [Cytophagales bacterium]